MRRVELGTGYVELDEQNRVVRWVTGVFPVSGAVHIQSWEQADPEHAPVFEGASLEFSSAQQPLKPE